MSFVGRDELIRDFTGLLLSDDRLKEDLRQDDGEPEGRFAYTRDRDFGGLEGLDVVFA